MKLYERNETADFIVRNPLGEEVGLKITTRSKDYKPASDLGQKMLDGFKKRGREPSGEESDEMSVKIAFARCVGWTWYNGQEKHEFNLENFLDLAKDERDVITDLLLFQRDLSNFMA